MTRVVIISVPYTEPLPMVAPVLLSACLNQAGISAIGIDFSIKFLNEFVNKPYWPELKNLFAIGVKPDRLPKRAVIDILKFIKLSLLDIKNLHNPEYIGLSIFTNESVNFSYLLIPYIRKYLPGVKIMLGGRGLELICGIYNIKNYEKYYINGMADIVVVGDSETAIVEVVKNNISGIYHAAPQTKEDLLAIPLARWADYNFDLYKPFSNYQIQEDANLVGQDPRYIAITASKGCVRKCTFCDVASFWPKYIYKDGEKIAQELIESYKMTGITNYHFTDNLINGSVSHYKKMNQMLAREIPNTISYSGYAIFRSKSTMPEEDFELAAKAGCKNWTVGIESGSERVRLDMKKKFSNDDMDFSIKNLHKNGIVQYWLFMVGFPTETDWDYKETENLLRRYAYLNKNNMISVSVTPTFQVLHNSPIIQDQNLVDAYGLKYSIKNNLDRYFWTVDINPSNTFATRFERWLKLTDLMFELGYKTQPGAPIHKWRDELTNLKKIYDETNPKPSRVFPITASR